MRNTLPALGLPSLAASPLAAQVTGSNVEELAKELANPGAANVTLNFKLEYRGFDSDLHGALDQGSTTLIFQPVFPFKLRKGNNLIFRPALVYIDDHPAPDGSGPDNLITSLQCFLFYGLGNGWQIRTGPTITYGWEATRDCAWMVPLQIAISKTAISGTQVVKFNLLAERNVVAPDAFAEDTTFMPTISPVATNPLQRTLPRPVDRAMRLTPIR
ncbi:MAG: hypothetical protein AAGK37_08075 [Pseudomonadota bacterium]